MFKNGSKSANDAESLGSPTAATTAQNEERPGKLILQNRRQNCKITEYRHWGCLFCGA
jgi:hypothetical protein